METFPPIEERLEQLLSRDYLYEDPESYRAGVIEAARLLASRDAPIRIPA